MNLDNVAVRNVSKSALYWRSNNADGNVALDLNVTNSLFTTTALEAQLSVAQSNDNSWIWFDSTVFRDYSSYYGEDFVLRVETEGARDVESDRQCLAQFGRE